MWKTFINKCNKIFKENPSAIIAFQETHFKENDAQGMAIMARFKTHNSKQKDFYLELLYQTRLTGLETSQMSTTVLLDSHMAIQCIY